MALCIGSIYWGNTMKWRWGTPPINIFCYYWALKTHKILAALGDPWGWYRNLKCPNCCQKLLMACSIYHISHSIPGSTELQLTRFKIIYRLYKAMKYNSWATNKPTKIFNQFFTDNGHSFSFPRRYPHCAGPKMSGYYYYWRRWGSKRLQNRFINYFWLKSFYT